MSSRSSKHRICKSELSDILEDDNLKYSDEKETNPTLYSDGEYSIYSSE